MHWARVTAYRRGFGLFGGCAPWHAPWRCESTPRPGRPTSSACCRVLPRPPASLNLPAVPWRATADRAGLGTEIKHDGYRLMARRDPVSVGIRLLTRNGHDWASRCPLIVQAVNKLKARSCLIDGEAVCCNENGMSSFEELRHRSIILFAFDLLELDGTDLRHQP